MKKHHLFFILMSLLGGIFLEQSGLAEEAHAQKKGLISLDYSYGIEHWGGAYQLHINSDGTAWAKMSNPSGKPAKAFKQGKLSPSELDKIVQALQTATFSAIKERPFIPDEAPVSFNWEDQDGKHHYSFPIGEVMKQESVNAIDTRLRTYLLGLLGKKQK